MAGTTPTLDQARDAYRRREWRSALEGFREATGHLTTDDVRALADCHWWLGDLAETNRLLESAHRRYLEEGRPEDAARAAMEVAINHFLRGDDALGSGWMGRALRLAQDLPPGPIHGYLTYVVEVEANWRRTEPDKVVGAARRVREIGLRHQDPNLIAASLNGEGRFLLERGRVAEGMALLDEAMITVLTGDLVPDWAGNIYCNTIAACHRVGDLKRMTKWTEATEDWLRGLSAAVVFAGICAVHRVQLMVLNGQWEKAETEGLRIAREQAGVKIATESEAWYQVGEVRRLRGQLSAAEEAYRVAHERGRYPQPGLARLRLAEGNLEAAAASIRSALVATDDPLRRAGLCSAAVEIALAAGDLAAADDACNELTRIADLYRTSGMEVEAIGASGALALARGEPERALPLLQRACALWRELNAPHQAASVCLLLARAFRSLGDDDAAELELATASATFERLGAALDAAVAAGMRGGSEPRFGLSRREREVLALVASGRSNRRIAEELFISEKTVARHLSNIFAKLGVNTRVEAARFAYEQRMVTPTGMGRTSHAGEEGNA